MKTRSEASESSLVGQSISGEAILQGQVFDTLSGAPIASAFVTLTPGTAPLSVPQDPSPRLPGPTVTRSYVLQGQVNTMVQASQPIVSIADSAGKFVIRAAPGVYRLAASANGYVVQEYGQRGPSRTGVPITISLGDNPDVVLRLAPEAALSGVVTYDDRGVVNLQVCLLRASFNVDGERIFRLEKQTTTDAQGAYLLKNVGPGAYYLVAGRRAGANLSREQNAYMWTYYPGVIEAGSAGGISIAPGTHLSDINIPLVRGESFKVSGHIIDYRTRKPPASAKVLLISNPVPFERPGSFNTQTQGGPYNPKDGKFEFAGLTNGTYRVGVMLPESMSAQSAIPFLMQRPQDANVKFEVFGSDLEDLNMLVPSGGSVHGRVIIADDTGTSIAGPQSNSATQMSGVRVGLVPLDRLQSFIDAPVNANDGTFEMTCMGSGEYRIQVALPGINAYVREYHLNGARIADHLLQLPASVDNTIDVILGKNGAVVNGVATDEQLQPAAGMLHGLLLPDPLPSKIGFYRQITTTDTGRFVIQSIPPGDYRIYIWKDVDEFSYFDRELIRRGTPQATAVSINEGAQIAVNVKTL